MLTATVINSIRQLNTVSWGNKTNKMRGGRVTRFDVSLIYLRPAMTCVAELRQTKQCIKEGLELTQNPKE